MSDIYQSAKEVVVWLGEPSNDLELAFDILGGKTRIELNSNFDFEKLNRSTTAFCDRDYWNRLWIVQEMLLARRVSYWCGQKVVSQKNMGQNSKSFLMRNGRDYQLPWILIDKACSGAQD
jgi:hypothetical protein